MTTTVAASDPVARVGWDCLYPAAGVLDLNHAGSFADWLEEHDDWRHMLIRAVAFCRSGSDGRFELHRPGVTTGRCSRRPDYATEHDSCRYTLAWADAGWVAVCSEVPVREEGVRTSVWSYLSPDEYDAARTAAADAGLLFPLRPLT